MVFNEAFCLALAREIGLDAAPATIARTEDIDYLLVERFDRHPGEEGRIARLHQEDFCQALGIPSEIKYQGEGGPSLADCFTLLRETSNAPVVDLRALLDAVLFNLIIGNHDAHAKNFSLLYLPDRSMRLAPLYDLVCTVFYPELTKKMAMKIGGEGKSNLVLPKHVARFAKNAGLAVPLTLARVAALAKAISAAIPNIEKPHEISEQVVALIAERAESFVHRFKKA